MSTLDAIETRPQWLSQSIVRVLKLPKELPLRPGVEGMAIGLLRSIEADEIPVPAIWSTSRGTIRIDWEHGGRRVCLSITGHDRYDCRMFDGRGSFPLRTVSAGRLDEMRCLIGWLGYRANGTRKREVPGWER